jgi:hypothetical protein
VNCGKKLFVVQGHAITHPIVEKELNCYGEKYTLQCSINTPDGRNPCIFSVWIIENGKLQPRLVTAYPG